jgi:uncharacterized protein (TIGR02996 family)
MMSTITPELTTAEMAPDRLGADRPSFALDAQATAQQGGLLADILEHPDDDAPRLIYADWLDEHGQPERAEFIRLQYTLAAAEARHEPPSRPAADRTHELLRRHREEWAADLLGPGVHDVHFSRGFVEGVAATTLTFIRQGRRWAERTPLRSACLGGAAARHGQELAACAHLQGLTELSILDRNFREDDVIALARSPHLARLTALRIDGEIGDRGTLELTQAPFFARLRRLELTSADLKPLVSPGAALPLEHLALTSNQILDGGAVALAQAPRLANLTRLNLDANLIRPRGLVALVTSPQLKNLRWLGLARNHLRGGGLEEWAYMVARAGKPALTQLTEICLNGNRLRRVNVTAVAAILSCHPKARLSLEWCAIPRPVRDELRRRFGHRVSVND